MTGESFDVFPKLDVCKKEFLEWDRSIIKNQIARLDERIAEKRKEIARSGNETDIEIVRLAQDARANWMKVLGAIEREVREIDRPQTTFGEMLDAYRST